MPTSRSPWLASDASRRSTSIPWSNSTQNLFPVPQSATFTIEEDRVPSTLSTGFETGFSGWTSQGFVRQGRRFNTGATAIFAGPNEPPAPAHACDDSADGALECKTLHSPPFLVGAGSTFQVSNWYQLEPASGGRYWDRANVHVIDAAGVHRVILPASGKPYRGIAGQADASLCHLDREDGWAGTGMIAGTWSASTFNLAPYVGQEIQLEINYNTDDGAICEGIYLDDFVLTNATVRGCDQLDCAPGGCSSTPLAVTDVLAVKDVSVNPPADVVFSWSSEAAAAGGYRVYRANLDPALVPQSHNPVPAGVQLAVSTAPSVTATTAVDPGAVVVDHRSAQRERLLPGHRGVRQRHHRGPELDRDPQSKGPRGETRAALFLTPGTWRNVPSKPIWTLGSAEGSELPSASGNTGLAPAEGSELPSASGTSSG